MRTRRCIALLMTALYLLVVGAPVYAALTCECATTTRSAHSVCCHNCGDGGAAVGGHVHMEAPCCSDRHSTEIALYTVSANDADKYVKRIAAVELPPALAPEPLVSVSAGVLVCCARIVPHGSGTVPDAHIASCGLRAPPVLV